MAITKSITAVASVAMPINEQWTIKRCRYAPQGEQKGRVCIATGIHGDEMMGQLIVYGIASRIMQEPDALRGIVDLYPMLNPLGLDIGERMVPAGTRLDMNRAFPGSPEGTPLEYMCYASLSDMTGADLVLDIHASTQNKSELYEVRLSAKDADRLVPRARALCPDLIWIYPDNQTYSSSLTGALTAAGTDAMILEIDERHRRPQDAAQRVVDGIFCKLSEMGLWTGITGSLPEGDILVVHSRENVQRVACEAPGIYVPEDCIGKTVQAGEKLGVVIDALEGIIREEVQAPCAGLVFSQRSYSAVYPGTLIARIRKEQA